MTVSAVILEVLAIVRVLPEAAEAITAWFTAHPNATVEETAAKLAEYRAAADARRSSVAQFNASLQ